MHKQKIKFEIEQFRIYISFFFSFSFDGRINIWLASMEMKLARLTCVSESMRVSWWVKHLCQKKTISSSRQIEFKIQLKIHSNLVSWVFLQNIITEIRCQSVYNGIISTKCCSIIDCSIKNVWKFYFESFIQYWKVVNDSRVFHFIIDWANYEFTQETFGSNIIILFRAP